MKTLLVLLSLLSFSLHAEERVSAVTLSEGPLTTTAAPDNQFQLLLELPDPGISMPVYALKGMISYEGVEGDGYLQLDSHIGDAGTFFSKSLAPAASAARARPKA